MMESGNGFFVHQAVEEVLPGIEQQLLQRSLETGWLGAWADTRGESVAADSNQAQLGLWWMLQELAWEQRRLTQINQTLERQLEQQTAQVQALASALSKAEQQERKRIAQLLHDDLQQLLYGQGVQLKTLKWQVAVEGTAVIPEQIEEILELIDQAIRMTRMLAVGLNPPGLEAEELSSALQWLIRHMAETYGLDVQLTTQGSCRLAKSETRSLLMQMVRELLFNVVKHARTDQAVLDLWQEDGMIIIRITDEGQGFDLEGTRARQARCGGFGLFSIEERINLIGGQLEIESSPGQGTRISLIIPIEKGRE